MKESVPVSSNENKFYENNELPEGWKIVHLSDVANLFAGSGFPEKYQGQPNLPYPFFKVGNLADVESGDYLLKSNHTVDDKIIHDIHARVMPQDSIVFAKIGMAIQLNRRRLIGVPSCIDNNMMAAVPKDNILPQFLLRFLETVEFMPLTQATTVPSLRKKDLELIELPLPPLSGQHRIVARVEALLSQVNAARDRLNRVPLIMKRFRQAVLAAACSGKLTDGWREEYPDVESVKHLICQIEFDRRSTWQLVTNIHRENKSKIRYPEPQIIDVENLSSLPDSWSWVTLDQIVEEGRPIVYGIIKPGPDMPDGVLYVRVNEMVDGKYVDVTKLRRASKEIAAKYTRAELKTDDILISKDGTIGRVALVPPELNGGNITQHTVRATIHPFLNKFYIVKAIQSPFSQRWLENEKKGVALQGVNVEDFRRLPIPLPPLGEQHEIVRRVDALFALADQIEYEVAEASKKTEALTQTVLAKAFRGELVEREAELSNMEGREYAG